MWNQDPFNELDEIAEPPSWLKTGLLLAILGVVLILLWAVVEEVRAEPAGLSQGQVTAAYAVAYGHVGHIPQKPPTIVIVPRSRMCEVAGQPGCRMPGLERLGVIYLIDTLDPSNPFDASILVHELVHYVQFDKLGEATTCEERIRREREAYEIQAIALDMAGFPSRHLVASVSALRCS